MLLSRTRTCIGLYSGGSSDAFWARRQSRISAIRTMSVSGADCVRPRVPSPVQPLAAADAYGTQAAEASAWPASSAATPVTSPAPIPAAVDQAAASSSPIRQLDRDEVAREAWRGIGDDARRRWLHG